MVNIVPGCAGPCEAKTSYAQTVVQALQHASPLKICRLHHDHVHLLFTCKALHTGSKVLNFCNCLQTEAMPVNQWVYNAKLAQLCGPDVQVQPDWLRTLYSVTSANILGSPDSFRDVWGEEELAAFKLADQFCHQMLQCVA